MSEKRRIFISSVQKELELERAAVAGLISTDPFFISLGVTKQVGSGRSTRYRAAIVK